MASSLSFVSIRDLRPWDLDWMGLPTHEVEALRARPCRSLTFDEVLAAFQSLGLQAYHPEGSNEGWIVVPDLVATHAISVALRLVPRTGPLVIFPGLHDTTPPIVVRLGDTHERLAAWLKEMQGDENLNAVRDAAVKVVRALVRGDYGAVEQLAPDRSVQPPGSLRRFMLECEDMHEPGETFLEPPSSDVFAHRVPYAQVPTWRVHAPLWTTGGKRTNLEVELTVSLDGGTLGITFEDLGIPE